MTAATTAATALVIVESHFGNTRTIARAVAAGRIVLPGPTSIARMLIEDWYGGPVGPRSDWT